MTKTWTIEYEGFSYPVTLTYKRIRNINFRLSRDGKTLKVSAPYGTSLLYLNKKVGEYFPKLKRKLVYEPSSSGDEVYLFDEKETIGGFSSWDDKKKTQFLKTKLLSYLQGQVPAKEGLLSVRKPYEVRVRSMRSRYGVNSLKTHRLTFALELVHYAPEIIDSVIVHELSHDFERNHGPRFYAILFAHCPDYKKLYACLRKHHYAYE